MSTNDDASDANRTDGKTGLLEGKRRSFLKLAGGGLGLSAISGSAVANHDDQTVRSESPYQVDLVADHGLKDPLDADGFSGDGTLIRWIWGDQEGNTAEGELDKYDPFEGPCAVETVNGVELDHEAGTASVEVEVSDCGDGDVQLQLVSYTAPAGLLRWDEATADQQRLFDENRPVFGEGTHTIEIDLPYLEAPFGINPGGGDSPVVIDGLEFEDAYDNADEPWAITGATAWGALNVSTADTDISGTEHDALYQSELWGGENGFDIFIENGTYDVVLHFAETWFGQEGGGGEGSRVFDVDVQGETVLEDFDIYAEAGPNTAITQHVQEVEVTDGILTISGEASQDNVKYCGIEVRENPLANPSFERVADGEPEDWDTWVWGGDATHEASTDAHSGAQSAMITADGDGVDGSWRQFDVPVEPNTQYVLKGRIKTENVEGDGHGALLNVDPFAANDTGAMAGPVSGTTDWQPVEWSFTTGSEDDLVTVNCSLGGWGHCTGTAWYDDLRLVRVGPAPV